MTCPDWFFPFITDYIGFYENIIPDSVCDNIIAHDWGMRKSTYSNNDGKSKTSDERVDRWSDWTWGNCTHQGSVVSGS